MSVSPLPVVMLRRSPAQVAAVDRRGRMAECLRWRVARRSFPDQRVPVAGGPPTPPWRAALEHAGPGESSACRLRSRWSAPSRHCNSTETAGNARLTSPADARVELATPCSSPRRGRPLPARPSASSGARLLGDPVGERDRLPTAAAHPRPVLLDHPGFGRMAEQPGSPDGVRVDAPFPVGLGRRMTHGQLPTRSQSTIRRGCGNASSMVRSRDPHRRGPRSSQYPQPLTGADW